jgi:electron-transferring-flavoprotein dehydrogenase
MSAREHLETDIVIVGAGPAGLSCAIRLAQLAKEQSREYSITVLEKGAAVGAHTLSGAVFDPKALNQLIPDWKSLGAPVSVNVTRDRFYWLSQRYAFRCPVPSVLNNRGHYIISLGQLCAWLAEQATALGVDIFPGYPAADIISDDSGTIIGVQTADMGLDAKGAPLPNYTPGINIFAKQVVLAEGCRGSLAQKIIKSQQLYSPGQFQTYGLGFKEVWEVDSADYQAGTVIHTVGYPLGTKETGGGFIYHAAENKVNIGCVVSLDYQDPYFDPYETFQQYKHHPYLQRLLKGGRCLRYGARSVTEGGWQSIPTMDFAGGMLIGCSAGLLNVAKIKGSHTAMGSGILAAEHLMTKEPSTMPHSFTDTIKSSWIGHELWKVRNVRPGFARGLKKGMMNAAIECGVFRGYSPWTLKHKTPDHASLRYKSQYPKREYPSPDGVFSFDKMTSVQRSNVFHRENQPTHLALRTPSIATSINVAQFAAPETRYCPAGVYEYVKKEGSLHLQINAQNCIHCKACDIKDPTQNIEWTVPEGGGGPQYGDM